MPAIPSIPAGGPEWQIGGLDDSSGTTLKGGVPGAAGPGGFGGMLSNSIGALEKSQTEAAGASQALAAGTATDPTSVVMSVERARLSMQLASQIRTKAVEAAQDIFHTQV